MSGHYVWTFCNYFSCIDKQNKSRFKSWLCCFLSMCIWTSFLNSSSLVSFLWLVLPSFCPLKEGLDGGQLTPSLLWAVPPPMLTPLKNVITMLTHFQASNITPSSRKARHLTYCVASADVFVNWLILSIFTLRSCLGYIFLLVSSLPEYQGICVVSILTRHCNEEKAILFWDILLCCPGWPWTSELLILPQCCKNRPLSPDLAVRGLNKLK